MTKFERAKYTAEVLEQAYYAVQAHDNCWNKELENGEYGPVCEDRQEHHKICLDVMSLIEKMLQTVQSRGKVKFLAYNLAVIADERRKI